jgi:hypothetical protein
MLFGTLNLANSAENLRMPPAPASSTEEILKYLTDKSFLVLFFKKELLPLLPSPTARKETGHARP